MGKDLENNLGVVAFDQSKSLLFSIPPQDRIKYLLFNEYFFSLIQFIDSTCPLTPLQLSKIVFKDKWIYFDFLI
jgi:hypothetical protein